MNILFLDTEFTSLNKNGELISIALYHSEECYFYAEFNNIDYKAVPAWIQEHVVSRLEFIEQEVLMIEKDQIVKLKGSTTVIKQSLEQWISQFDQIEIWADVLAYDWVFFCNIFGGALDIPKNIFYIPFDLSTLLKLKDRNPDLNRFELASHLLSEEERKLQHHALVDAKVGKLCYEMIT